MQISNYQLSLELFKLYKDETMSKEWLHLYDQMLLGGRQTKFLMLKSNQLKIVMKSLVNKFYVLNNKIDLSHFLTKDLKGADIRDWGTCGTCQPIIGF